MSLAPCSRIKLTALPAATTLLIMAAGCVGRHERGAPRIASETMGQFAGNAACAKCHREECEGFDQTNHALTFRRMTPESLGSQAPPAGPLPGTKCVLELTDNRYSVTVPSTGERKTLDYALGSGKTGMTYISVENETTLTEMRMSYFPSRRAWFNTPGQEREAKNPVVVGHNHGNNRQCMLCHNVGIPANSLRPDPRLMGVGCETCHGPALAHVQALSHGSHGQPLEKLKGANGERINAICGTCHRTVEDVLALHPREQNTARFPVFGLAMSRCFQASAGSLTCITCHNPHRNASKSAADYEPVCLKCHSNAGTSGGTTASPDQPNVRPSSGTPGKICPVNPRSGCIPCHMPQRKVFSGAVVPTTMADHLIKVYGKANTSLRRQR